MASEDDTTGDRVVGLNSALRDKIKTMPFKDLVDMMVARPPSTLAALRSQYRYGMARLEQASAQRRSLTTEEYTRREFDAVFDLLDVVGVKVEDPCT